jgi:hypothetical protein
MNSQLSHRRQKAPRENLVEETSLAQALAARRSIREFSDGDGRY